MQKRKKKKKFTEEIKDNCFYNDLPAKSKASILAYGTECRLEDIRNIPYKHLFLKKCF